MRTIIIFFNALHECIHAYNYVCGAVKDMCTGEHICVGMAEDMCAGKHTWGEQISALHHNSVRDVGPVI